MPHEVARPLRAEALEPRQLFAGDTQDDPYPGKNGYEAEMDMVETQLEQDDSQVVAPLMDCNEDSQVPPQEAEAVPVLQPSLPQQMAEVIQESMALQEGESETTPPRAPVRMNSEPCLESPV